MSRLPALATSALAPASHPTSTAIFIIIQLINLTPVFDHAIAVQKALVASTGDAFKALAHACAIVGRAYIAAAVAVVDIVVDFDFATVARHAIAIGETAAAIADAANARVAHRVGIVDRAVVAAKAAVAPAGVDFAAVA